jgi:hypothetical protein
MVSPLDPNSTWACCAGSGFLPFSQGGREIYPDWKTPFPLIKPEPAQVEITSLENWLKNLDGSASRFCKLIPMDWKKRDGNDKKRGFRARSRVTGAAAGRDRKNGPGEDRMHRGGYSAAFTGR